MTAAPRARLAVLGAGKMGGTLIRGLLNAGTLSAQEVIATAAHQPRLEILRDELGVHTTLDNRVAVPMRDGVVLYADVYRPATEGKYPVIVSRTPYSTERPPASYAAAVFFARRGYVYVYQDVRGRHESEGR